MENPTVFWEIRMSNLRMVPKFMDWTVYELIKEPSVNIDSVPVLDLLVEDSRHKSTLCDRNFK